MSISVEEVKRYFQEIAIALRREGFRTEPGARGRLGVWLDDHPICEVDQVGGITYRSDNIPTPELVTAKDKVCRIVCNIAEYMRQMKQAPTLKADGLAESYRLISEFNGTVLAAKESRYGVEFATWEWVNDHSSLWQGHYFGLGSGAKGYLAAKRDFAGRSGLLEQDQLFSDEQLSEIYRCIHETLDNCYPMTAERSKLLMDTAEQIERAVPQLEFLVEQSNLNEMEVLEQNQSMTQQC